MGFMISFQNRAFYGLDFIQPSRRVSRIFSTLRLKRGFQTIARSRLLGADSCSECSHPVPNPVGDGNYNDGYQDMLANYLPWSLTLGFCHEVAQNCKNGQSPHETDNDGREERQKKDRHYESQGEDEFCHERCDGGAPDLSGRVNVF